MDEKLTLATLAKAVLEKHIQNRARQLLQMEAEKWAKVYFGFVICSTCVASFYPETSWYLTLPSFYCLIRATQLSRAQVPEISARVDVSNDTLSVRISGTEMQFEQLSAAVPALPRNDSFSDRVEEIIPSSELENSQQEASDHGVRQRSGFGF